MAKYEVHIPPPPDGGPALTLRVTADNWMSALKTGLAKIGQPGALTSHILCDIMDDQSVHVTDPKSGRVFRIVELEGDEAQGAGGDLAPVRSAEDEREEKTDPELSLPAFNEDVGPEDPTQLATKPHAVGDLPTAPGMEPLAAGPIPLSKVVAAGGPARPERPAAPEPLEASDQEPTGEELGLLDTAKSKAVKPGDAPRIIVRAKPSAPAAEPAFLRPNDEERRTTPSRPSSKAPPPRVEPSRPRVATRVEELPQPARPVQGPIGRASSAKYVDPEEVFAELFERVQDAQGKSKSDALYFFLDLALEKIPAESGSILVSALGKAELEFAAARGPKSDEILRLRAKVPMGKGIAGFCAQEGVALAISDAQKDKRLLRQISQRVGYETRSMLCAPMTSSGRTFGCVQLINRKANSTFEDRELAILNYVAHQVAQFLEQHAPG